MAYLVNIYNVVMPRKKNIEDEYHVSQLIIIYKFVLGIFEVLLGLGVFFGGKQILDIYENFKSNEFLEDPHDLLLVISEKIIPVILKHQTYIILILLALGLVKIIGSVGLWKRKHWGLDLLVGLTIILLPFDLIVLFPHPSLLKFFYFFINVLIALYLVEFKPKDYFTKFKKRVKR